MYVHGYVMYVCMYVCMYIHVCIYIHVCMHMYIHVYVSYSDLFILSGTIKEILFKISGWKEFVKF